MDRAKQVAFWVVMTLAGLASVVINVLDHRAGDRPPLLVWVYPPLLVIGLMVVASSPPGPAAGGGTDRTTGRGVLTTWSFGRAGRRRGRGACPASTT